MEIATFVGCLPAGIFLRWLGGLVDIEEILGNLAVGIDYFQKVESTGGLLFNKKGHFKAFERESPVDRTIPNGLWPKESKGL